MRIKTALLILSLALHATIASAQQPVGGAVAVRGSISPKTMIEMATINATSADGLAKSLIRNAGGGDKVTLRLVGAPDDGISQVRVRLLMRTNTVYRLHASVSSIDSAPPIALLVTSMRATGRLVIPAALVSTRMASAPVHLSSEPRLIAEGPRISVGAPHSPSNAIEIELLVEVSSKSSSGWSGDLVFTISPA
jgi:hypothetical protein